jgi:hypothetical protein
MFAAVDDVLVDGSCGVRVPTVVDLYRQSCMLLRIMAIVLGDPPSACDECHDIESVCRILAYDQVSGLEVRRFCDVL